MLRPYAAWPGGSSGPGGGAERVGVAVDNAVVDNVNLQCGGGARHAGNEWRWRA
jgi:hypothetical protein